MEYILPNSHSLSDEEKWSIQNDILLSVYDETYPVWNRDKAIEQVRQWVQKILFWWNDFESIRKSRWWTIALIKDKSKWDSCVEMCRAWSNLDSWWWISAVRKLYDYFVESDFNQLFATPRNCLERLNKDWEVIPSWKTISKIYSRLSNMQYWWIAPWYIMPWWVIELLDLCVYTKVDYVKTRLERWEKIYIFNRNAAEIFARIIWNNYGLFDVISIEHDIDYSEDASFDVDYDTNDRTRPYTYSTLKRISNGVYNLDNYKTIIDNVWSWVSIIKLDLFDKSNLDIQRRLEADWYVLVALFPEWDRLIWYWFNSSNKEYALPYYYLEKNDNFKESFMLQKQIIDFMLSK